MLPSDDVIAELTRAIFEAMLGLDLAGPLDSFTFSGGWELAIDITGRWNGTVTLAVPDELGRRAAAAMFACDPDAVRAEDIEDAVAELANMIGGNVKSLLPGPSELSLPRRQIGARAAHGARRLCFESGGIPFVLEVGQRAAA